MKTYDQFEQFGRKSGKATSVKTNNCVVYTRVSTKKQEDGYSLEIQLEAAEEYARRNKFNIIGHFGGKYESAQTDQERKEFNRMLKFAKSSKEKVSYVLVYTVDRFSRTGINGAYIKETLRHEGIDLVAVTQPTDTSNPGGRLQQNIQFIFSEYDNDLRREKSVGGMLKKVEEGNWVGRPPIGYDMFTKNKYQSITINETGKLVKQAFHWKYEGIGATEIARRLKARGLKMYDQKLGHMFSNPFYCGLIAHRLLNGKVVKGNHPAIVSEELFLAINKTVNRNGAHKKEFSETPLKHFIRCGTCDTPFTGYEVKKKKLHYYKCNRVSCKCNRSAKLMHQKFYELLNFYQLNTTYSGPLVTLMTEVFYEMNASNREAINIIKANISGIDQKLENMEERFAYGEINSETYQKFSAKLKRERKELQDKLAEVDFELSNPDEFFSYAIEYSKNLQQIWATEDYGVKKELQNLLFPEGIIYNRENDGYRTPKANALFSVILQVAREAEIAEKEKSDVSVRLSNWVGRRRIELHLKEKGVSAYCIKIGLKQIDEDEYLKVLHELAVYKFNSVNGKSDFEKKAKTANYLVGRGFESELVWQALKMED